MLSSCDGEVGERSGHRLQRRARHGASGPGRTHARRGGASERRVALSMQNKFHLWILGLLASTPHLASSDGNLALGLTRHSDGMDSKVSSGGVNGARLRTHMQHGTATNEKQPVAGTKR